MSMKLPFFNNKEISRTEINLEKVPKHVAIIMDGNGRWASKKGLPRIAGHKEGMDVVRKIVKKAVSLKIEVLTLYAFSTENWKRPRAEVDFIMKLPQQFLDHYLPELIENNVKIETIGEFSSLPSHTKKAIEYAKEMTKNNDGLLLNFAINYGSRYEILRAIKHLVKDIKSGKVSEDALTEELVSSYLYTKDVSDPDLLIRTSGEKRLSNFLLWQMAYSEFWFTDTLWPDFNEDIFTEAIIDYQNRKRRYGGI